MARGRKKPISLEEFIEKAEKSKEAKINRRKEIEAKYKKSLTNAGYLFNSNTEKIVDDLKLTIGKYSLRTRIKENKWVKDGRPASSALKWLYQEVLKNPKEYRWNKHLMQQGHLFTFEYKNPKYYGTSVLPYFDKFPLVLSLGPVVTKQGIRNIGFNLHLIPPAIRIIAICQIFEIYKKLYRFQIFYLKTGPINLQYKVIVNALKKYGLEFCIRMYIPQRQHVVVTFPYRDWYKAIFIPSRGYDGIKANRLIQEWKSFNKKRGNSISPNVDWKTFI